MGTRTETLLCISRKVKKSESKSQPKQWHDLQALCCVYPVKLKNLKANHNRFKYLAVIVKVVYIP